jgi:F0F1-type ATP synthase alpha subunit
MFVLLPQSMPSDLFYLTSSLVCEIYQIANLLSTGSLSALLPLAEIRPATV